MAQLEVGTQQGLRIAERLLRLDWFLVVLVCTIGAVGIGMLISASGGSTEPWAARQMVWFGAGLIVMLAVAIVDIGFWLRAAYTIYVLAFVLLVGVEVLGAAGKGAQRWIDIGVIQLQPSELMKIGLVLALARYFHGVALDSLGLIRTYIPPLLMILLPAALILRQPDLGTALLLALGGGTVLFLAGIKAWKIGVGIVIALGSGPIAWQFLHDYQKARILTFFNPEADPLGAGYHILQSKIALGSGGLFGKGYLQGTQSHLNFLPEKQTDFIFTMMAEELGFFGVAGVLLLYLGILHLRRGDLGAEQQPFRPHARHGHHGHVLLPRLLQRCDGDRAHPHRRPAAAADLLWGERHAEPDAGPRAAALRRSPPRRGPHTPYRRGIGGAAQTIAASTAPSPSIS